MGGLRGGDCGGGGGGDEGTGGRSPEPPGERLDKAVSFIPKTARAWRCNAMLNILPQSPALGGGA